MKTTKIPVPYAGNANKANGQTLSASEWNALSAAARDAQTALNSIFADTVVLTNASQDMTANKVYSVQSSIDLNGGTLTMPAGCTLLFEGGSISNGSLVLNNTRIEGEVSFSGVTISGSCANEVLTPQMFGAVGATTENSSNKAVHTNAFLNLARVLNNAGTKARAVYIPSGHYAVNKLIDIRVGCKFYGDGDSSVLDFYDGEGGLSFGSDSEQNYFNSCEHLSDCTITANATKGDKTLQLNSVTGISPEDYLIITDMADGSFCKDRRSYRTSEVVKVKSIDNNVVTLYGTLYGNYKTGSGAVGTVYDEDDHETYNSVNFEDGEATTLRKEGFLYRTAISKFSPKQYNVSDIKIISHEHSVAEPDTYFTFLVCGHKDSEFKNITIENYGNYVAAAINVGIDFKVEGCSIKNYATFTGDAYGLSIGHGQNYSVSNSQFRAHSHALATGGAAGFCAFNNRNFIYEKLYFDTSIHDGNTWKIDLDVHANSEYYRYVNIDAPHTSCDTGGNNVVIENCRFYHISTGFNHTGFTLRNCEAMAYVEDLLWYGYSNVNYEDYSIVVEGCKFHTKVLYNMQHGSAHLKNFIWRNNTCNGGLRLINGHVRNIIIEGNVVSNGAISVQLDYDKISVKNNIITNGYLMAIATNGAQGVVDNNDVTYDGSDEGIDQALLLSHFNGMLVNNRITNILNKTTSLIYDSSNVRAEGNMFRQSANPVDGSIMDVVNDSVVIFNNNKHNTSRYTPVYANTSTNAKVKCDNNPYYTAGAVANAGIIEALGEHVYFRNINKIGYVSNGQKGDMLTSFMVNENDTISPVLAQNPFTKGTTYYVKFRVNGFNNIYFCKTNEFNAATALLVNYDNSADNAVFTAPDPAEYPYIYLTAQNYDVWFRFYENRNVSDFDGAAFNVARSGAYASRPDAEDIYVGFRYFCTDKQTAEGQADGIEIIWNGTAWVDALGRTVS